MEQDSSIVEKRNEVTDAADAQRERVRELVHAATGDNTRRAYRTAINNFYYWGGLLPATEDVICRYIADQAPKVSHATLDLRLAALSQWHTLRDLPDPVSHPDVKKVRKGSRRKHPQDQRKAKALPVEDLEKIVTALAALNTPTAKRDSALLQMGFFGAFRRSELVAIRVEDLSWEPQGVIVRLPRSKTDQSARGIVKALPYAAKGGVCCPVTALRTWLDASGIVEGPVFRPLTKAGKPRPSALYDGTVSTILRQCAEAAALDYVPELSSHSLRRGLATSAYREGVPFRDIKRQGGWRNDATVHGYIEEASLFEENAAGGLLNHRKSAT